MQGFFWLSAQWVEKKEGELSAQLPISVRVVRRHDIVVGSYLRIDRLVTDLEDAPNAAADGKRPAVVTIGFPICGDEGARGQIPTLWQVVIEEGLQRHGINVGTVFISGERPKIVDQDTGDHLLGEQERERGRFNGQRCRRRVKGTET